MNYTNVSRTAAAVLALTLASHFLTTPSGAQEIESEEDYVRHVEELGWLREGEGKLKNRASIQIPPGFRFTNDEGSVGLMELYGNLETGQEHGLIAPEDLSWCVIFEFDPSGYVKDDEKDGLDADAMLTSMKANQKEGNKMRKKAGLEALNLVGWAREPIYNEATNNLEWATIIESEDGSQSVNYNTRLLGRKGVMESVLLCNPEQLESILPQYQHLLTGYGYTQGERYAEYQEGDHVAEYGLAALVVGGGVAVAAKAGLFKFLKPLLLGVVAILVGIGRFFGFRRNRE